MKYGVMTAVSRDREGLVARYTDSLRQWGANLYSGRGLQLGRMFVFDALFQVEEADWTRVAAGIRANLADASPTLLEAPAPVAFRNPDAHHYKLGYMQEDSVGIVSTLAEILCTHGASIVSLESESGNEQNSGAPIFRVNMQVDVPNDIAVQTLRVDFNDLLRYKGWEIDFKSEPRAGMQVRATAPYPPSDKLRWGPEVAPAAADAPYADPAQWAVLSTISSDRPGIIASCAKFLAQRRANIHTQDARRIGEMFSAHYLFRASAADMERVKREYRTELSDFKPTLVESPRPTAALASDDLRIEMTVHAIDEPGILAALTQPITMHGASIAALSFGLYPGTGSNATSKPLFVVEMSLLVRDFLASKHIEAELRELKRDRGWEIDYHPRKKPVDAVAPKGDA